MTDELERFIRGGDRTELIHYVEHIEQIGMSGKMPRVVFRLVVFMIINTIYEIVYSVAGDEGIEVLHDIYYFEREDYFDVTLPEFEKVKKACVKAKDIVADKRKQSSNQISGQVLQILESDYNNPQLSVQYVSDIIGVSPNYLSSIIKRETGSTFVELMTQKIIENAQRMLLHTDLKIRDIAEQCGYGDQYYFSHCFKKITGESPGGYRKNNGI